LAKKSAKKSTKKTTKSKARIITGKFIGNAKGFGFVAPDASHSEKGADIFIPPHFTFGALNGDVVTCRISPEDKPRVLSDAADQNLISGKITEINKRAPMIGTFYTEGRQGLVRPVDIKIPYVFSVPPKSIARFGLADGHRVIFSVDKREKPDEGLCQCFITEVMGHTHDPGMDVLTLVYQAGVPYEFSDEVMREATELPDEISDAAPTRRDLRDQLIFTIDGDDTKDIDDAISFEPTDGGFRLGVHIVDVSHYVQENSALDAAALERGTSIYLADRVIPMLPHKLSSGICSLFPEVDRLALSCVMDVDLHGNVLRKEIFPSIIRSKKRWTYTQVQNLLDGLDSEDQWQSLFDDMDELRELLWEKRRARGALDFDLPEAKIRVDDNGRPISIEPYPRTRATGIIEEFMILCNETIASYVLENDLTGIFRTHEAPNEKKLAQLGGISKSFGFTLPQRAQKPMILQRLLNATAGLPHSIVIATAVLHSLPQAHYTADNPTHYGLASQAYCHFTSPIRRYADLQLHRVIKANLSGQFGAVRQHFNATIPGICAQCSRAERIAEVLERDVAQLKKVQFMEGCEGKIFDASISGITAWGVYVMLANTIEGLIPKANLNVNRYYFDPEQNHYKNKNSGTKKAPHAPKFMRPGDMLRVKLVDISVENRKLMFVLS